MTEITISVNSLSLTINHVEWTTAPPMEDFCRTLGLSGPTDGANVIINGKPDAKFRYFDAAGISFLETIPGQRVRRVSIHFLPASEVKPEATPYGTGGERATEAAFQGLLKLNGAELRYSALFKHFRGKGDLNFINTIAVGPAISAMVDHNSRVIRKIVFEFQSFE